MAGPDLGQGEQTQTAGPVSYCSQARDMEGYREGSMSKVDGGNDKEASQTGGMTKSLGERENERRE